MDLLCFLGRDTSGVPALAVLANTAVQRLRAHAEPFCGDGDRRPLRGVLMAVFEHQSDSLLLVFLFHLLGMIYPSLKRKCAPNPGWFTPTICSKDPDDDYLISLALSTQSVIVSGDSHLLALSDEIPVYSPTDF